MERNTQLVHGGDWAGYQAAYGRECLDFSANVSPLGVPEGVQAALRSAAARADRYPDPLCRELAQAIGAAEGVPVQWVLCGGGAASLIFRAVLAVKPRRALVTAPTFGEYEAALALADCRIEHYPLAAAREFRVGEDLLAAITPELDLLFLCEPNNPTGVTTSQALLERIAARCGETGTWMIVDECFGGFLEAPEAHTLSGILAENPHVLILKAFTKLYAMAGVRLGYALCAGGALLDGMRRAGPPWEVSALAQEGGVAALKERDYVDRVRAVIGVQRRWLAGALKELGLRTVPGEANYLLFQGPSGLIPPLEDEGILLRGCGNYCGLDETWYRAAVRTNEENRRLIAALGKILRYSRPT
ncbi:aminotransferase class I/II-fold pyridoxal phosphate-dependent enzyme [Pseudoflavonifractor sp. 524-17]|uniref:aminotransferase class I/II-fold pyridoxal phosphate-dependent enzyme n=1 Tax=Pseudoflavonifractor sp. 524-17 TaxID=2304577 RepID=UPI001379DC61|nr:aminotransferase class I/II-fold pyridoxal phosphate-dependent enzyme [Pseudoflavonifractor sp. 524-17]